MSWLPWAVSAICVLAACFGVFMWIARKGRALRRNQPLPPPAERAYLRWEEDGQSKELEVSTPFYMGKDPASQIILASSRVAYEACIFYHNSRFAFQTLPGGGPILVNGDESLAGYLWDGDAIVIANRKFRFLCY